MRHLAIQTLAANIDQFANYFHSDDPTNVNYLQQELQRLSRLNTFAGQECILALAKALHINILVTMGGDESAPDVTTIEHSFEPQIPRIHISWTRTGGGHYEAITENPSASQITMPCQINNLEKVVWKSNTNVSKTVNLGKFDRDSLNEKKSTNTDKVSDFNLHSYSKASFHTENNHKTCKECHKTFKTTYSLRRHDKQIHIEGKAKGKLKCMIPSCQFNFAKVNEVIEHAVNGHGADIITDNLVFDSKAEFEEFVKKGRSNR